jgi:hypothetical protein
MAQTIPVPKPKTGYVYAEAATKSTHPTNVRYYQGIGYEKVGWQKAVKELGFDDRAVSDGGFIDKTNNAVSTGDLILMEAPVEAYVAFRQGRFDSITAKGRRIDDEFKEEVGRAAYDVKEALA